MKIEFACDNCNTRYSAAPQQAGKSGICKNCGAKLRVPHANGQTSSRDESKSDWSTPALPKVLHWIVANPARAAVVIFTFLMLYQAALPSGLTLDPAARTISLNVRPSATFSISRADVVGNVVPYFIFGHFVFLASWRRHRAKKRALWIAFFGSIGMALAVEFVQFFNLYRGSAIWDIISGAIGGSMALATGIVQTRFLSDKINKWVNREISRNPVIVAAAMLAAALCWDAARPFYVISSGNTLSENIKYSVVIPFTPKGTDIRDQLHLRDTPASNGQSTKLSADYLASLLERLLSYLVLFSLLSAGRGREGFKKALLQYLGVLFLIELISLGIVHGGVDITHIVVGILAVPIAQLGVSMYAKQPKQALFLLLTLFVFYIFISDLRPYKFGEMEELRATHFIPLSSHVASTDVMMLANIVEAAAVYAPIAMLLYLFLLLEGKMKRKKRWPSMLMAVLVCAGLGLLMEVVQLWIPARTSNIEDVLYAACGGYIGVSAARLYYYTTKNSIKTSQPSTT